MAFKRVGFFREQYDDESELPSIRDFVRAEPHPDTERMAAYLRSGVGLAGVGKYVDDVLDPTSRVALTPGLDTGGVWLWREDLPHYVTRHNVALPEEFVVHMRANGWTVPSISSAEVTRLSRQLFRDMGGEEDPDPSGE
jgi:hypothetical protein